MPEERTALHGLHAELGARFTPFAGYEMPVQYRDGLRVEHLHTRNQAGLFDVSHMGQVRVTGPGLHAALERALPLDFEGWKPGVQRYSLLLNERGGIEDDLMVTALADEVRIVANAGCKQKDVELLRKLCSGLSFEILDRSLIALQGPESEAVLAALAPAVARLAFMQTATVGDWLVSRSGYTGEDGFEISIPAKDVEAFCRRLLDEPRVMPIGLGARDTLRLEAGLCLYGHDIDKTTSPVEADLLFSIGKRRREQGGFPGAARIQREIAEGPVRRRVGLKLEGRAPAREGCEIHALDGTPIGVVTSGSFAPTLGGPIAMGYVETASASPGTSLHIVIRGTPHPATVVSLPFVPNRYHRKKLSRASHG
jgi:aminomethyltransferase